MFHAKIRSPIVSRVRCIPFATWMPFERYFSGSHLLNSHIYPMVLSYQYNSMYLHHALRDSRHYLHHLHRRRIHHHRRRRRHTYSRWIWVVYPPFQ